MSFLGFTLGGCVHSSIYTSRVEARFPPDGEMVEVNGTDMHVLRMGQPGATPVLLVHGASANAHEFDWSLAPNAGLYLRHRWMDFEDRSFPEDTYAGTETTLELKVFF